MTNKEWKDKPEPYRTPTRLDLGVLRPGDKVMTSRGEVVIAEAKADGTYTVYLDKVVEVGLKGDGKQRGFAKGYMTNVFRAKRVMTLQIIGPEKSGYHDD